MDWNRTGRCIGTAMAMLPALAGGSEQAGAAPVAQDGVSITIYNNDLALVQDVRSIDFRAGRSDVEFPDVSAQIRPETVAISAPGASVVEQNFDYDLLSPARLVDKAVGQAVNVVHTNPATGAETTEQAKILANNGGTLVQIGDRIEILGDMHARLVFDRLPEGLKARPTLSVSFNSPKDGRRPVALSYLSNGFAWKADYVALYDESAGAMDVQGWITLTNRSGTGFAKAKVLLVAGGGGQSGAADGDRPAGVVGTGGTADEAEQLGDFHVYPIAGQTSLANAQQKQVSFLDMKAAPAAKSYWYRNGWMQGTNEPVSFASVLRLSNGNGASGRALPAGTVRVYMRDASGQPQFVGEDNIAHTPAGSTLVLRTGDAFDVKIQPVVEKRERIASDEWGRVARYRISGGGRSSTAVVEQARSYWRTHMSYRLSNARAVPVTVEVVQAGLDTFNHDTRVSAESVVGTQTSADERVWRVTLPAHGAAVLTAQIDTRQ